MPAFGPMAIRSMFDGIELARAKDMKALNANCASRNV